MNEEQLKNLERMFVVDIARLKTRLDILEREINMINNIDAEQISNKLPESKF